MAKADTMRAMPPGKNHQHARDFYLKEYECLRREIEWLLGDYRSLERNAAIAVGLSWAWLFEKKDTVPGWSWLFPCLFAILGAIRATGIMKSFTALGEYISKIEDAFSSIEDPGGWEHGKPRPFGSSRFAGAFWALLILSTLVVAYFEWIGISKNPHGRLPL
jgi:hypothetical protein